MRTPPRNTCYYKNHHPREQHSAAASCAAPVDAPGRILSSSESLSSEEDVGVVLGTTTGLLSSPSRSSSLPWKQQQQQRGTTAAAPSHNTGSSLQKGGLARDNNRGVSPLRLLGQQPRPPTSVLPVVVAPRPVLVSMLNNKAVNYMERHQYAQAKKSLSRALRMAEQRRVSGTTTMTTDGSGSTSPAPAVATTRTTTAAGLLKGNLPKTALFLASSDDASQGTKSTEDPSSSSENENSSITSHSSNNSTSSSGILPLVDMDDGDHPLLHWPLESKEISCSRSNHHHLRQVPLVEPPSSSSDVMSTSSRNTTTTSSAATTTTTTPFKHRAEYDEGMDYFQTPLRLDDASRSVDGTILFNLARVHHNQGGYVEALSLYKRSLRALEDPQATSATTTVDAPLFLAVLFGIGQIQYIRGDHSDSLKTYLTCLTFARSHFGEESIQVAACLNCIGVLHYIMPKGDAHTALEALQTSIHIRRNALGEHHIDVGTAWNNVGRVHFQQGQYDEAMEAYKKALRIRRRAQGTSVDTAATIFNIGQVFHQKGDKDRALRHYQEFLRLAKLHFGDFHRDICIVTTCIGQVFSEKKEFPKALRAFQHALKVGRVALGSVHAEIAITLNKLGNLFYETGDLDAALKAYHQGLQVELAVLEPGNPNVCVTYTNIAEIHKQRSEYERALHYYDKVLALQRRHNFEQLDIANTLSSIGYVKHQQGDYAGAMEVNQECLRLRRDVKGDVDEEVASTLTHIALVLLKMDLHDMALEVLTEAYRIRTALSPTKENREIAFTLYNIALIYHHQGSHERALAFYLETARVEKSALGTAHRDLRYVDFLSWK